MNDEANTHAMIILFLVRAARRPCDAAVTLALGNFTLKTGFWTRPDEAMIRIVGHISLLFVLSASGTAAKYDNCTKGIKDSIGDSFCDYDNNNEECAYDGGDCCTCTNFASWSDDYRYEIFNIFCRDPRSGCLDPRVDMYPNCTDGVIPNIGDGWCDAENNNEGCRFDGGDCCDCARASNESSFSLCADPGAECYNPNAVTVQSSCINGSIESIGDGVCDADNNNKGCLYDGGDCCMCTCTDGQFWRCGYKGFSCVDPDTITQEANLCVQLASPVPACPVGLQSEWVVESTIQAHALIKAVRCSGGSFHVTWKGKVILDETVSIFNGTFLNVTSADADSAIVGDGKSRLFAVVNASLHLCNITLSNGNTTSYGGAIAASRSRVTSEGVAFTGNVATSSGGAIFLSRHTYASFGGNIANTTFAGNAATTGNGGALYVEGGSYVIWTGNSIFSENSCLGDGGAVSLVGESYALWTGKTTFTWNTATVDGGALSLNSGSRVVWTANAHFLGNTARFGGAVSMFYSSRATWTADSHFVANRAIYGGALFLYFYSNASWAGKTFFSTNAADADGGALYIDHDSVVAWKAESCFLDNHAGSSGGALIVLTECTAEWTAAALFSANSAALDDGGAIFASYGASLSWSETTSFINNIAREGGAIFVRDGAMVEWSGETRFISNQARSSGGAVGSGAYQLKSSIYANNKISKMIYKGATSFVNNECGGSGGGMALVQSLDVSFENGRNIFSGNTAGSSGGAVFIGGTGIGTVFENVSFVENTAQIGGGVRVTASGTTITVGTDNKQETNPTTFDRCRFVGNVTFGTGGAVDSASGLDVFANTLFEGNVAKSGGALRLAGKVSIDNCSFIDNVSELGGGPAVSNVGLISNVTTSNFHHNVFNCEPHAFLDFVKARTVLSNVNFTGPWSCLSNEMVLNNQFPTVQIFVDAAKKKHLKRKRLSAARKSD